MLQCPVLDMGDRPKEYGLYSLGVHSRLPTEVLGLPLLLTLTNVMMVRSYITAELKNQVYHSLNGQPHEVTFSTPTCEALCRGLGVRMDG